MLEATGELLVREAERVRSAALLRFASELFASADLTELEHKLVTGFGGLIYAPIVYVVPLGSADWASRACGAGQRQ
jgi:hypothetical protein